MAIKILAGIAKDGTNEGTRVSAAVALLDRGWGKQRPSWPRYLPLFGVSFSGKAPRGEPGGWLSAITFVPGLAPPRAYDIVRGLR